ncbi:hypothetical protein Hanom_Chr15g01401281 [Helianthus anomalus]
MLFVHHNHKWIYQALPYSYAGSQFFICSLSLIPKKEKPYKKLILTFESIKLQ